MSRICDALKPKIFLGFLSKLLYLALFSIVYTVIDTQKRATLVTICKQSCNSRAGRDICFEGTDGPREQHVSSYRRVKHIIR